MNLLQASMKDRSAKTWQERRTMFRVGSVFKGCRHCGDTEEDEETGSIRYLTGLQVFRSYDPKFVGWTWWCWDCGAKDLACWEPDVLGLIEAELGKPPLMGNRDVKKKIKYQLRKEATKFQEKEERVPSRAVRIAELQAEIERLKLVLEKGVVA